MKLMKVIEPITNDNLSELRPGEWIWDNKTVSKPAHKKMMTYEKINEPYGFRQIHILNVTGYKNGASKCPFMLTDIARGCNTWEKLQEGRFFKFKWEELKEL